MHVIARVQEVALPSMGLCGRIPLPLTAFYHLKTLNLGDFNGGE